MSTAPTSSFQPLQAETLYRTIARSSGEVGSGKTRFWLTAPKPLYMQSLDKGLEGTVNQLMAEGLLDASDIHIAEYDWHPGSEDFSQEYAENLRDRLINDYHVALDLGRTVVWDKESDIWELFRYAAFGKPNEAPKDYAKLNQRYLALINKAKGYDVSLGLIQSMKDAWGSAINPQTGKKQPVKLGYRVPWGFDRLDEAVFLELHHRREKAADGGASDFIIEVGKSRQNTAIQDQSFPGGLTFPQFGTLLLEGSTEEDWR